MIFKVMMAANYLDCKPLLDLTCKHVANQTKNLTPEEVREKYRIPDAASSSASPLSSTSGLSGSSAAAAASVGVSS
jgi:hypothetical protein